MLGPRELRALVDRKEKLEALRKKYKPHDKQELILNAYKGGKTGVFSRCGRQSGKTQEAMDLAWLVAGLNPGSIVSIITPERKQGYKIYWKKRSIQNFGPKSWVSKIDNEHMTVYFKNGSYIEIDGSDNIDAHRGDKKDLIILDEYKDIHPDFFEEVVEPMLLTTDGKVLIIGTPPKTPESHYKDREMAALDDDDWEVVTWTSYDSPYTNKEKLDKKRAQMEKMGMLDTFLREYMAQYTYGGKDSVFQMFSRPKHMKDPEVVERYFEQNRGLAELYWIADPSTSSTFGSLLIAYIRKTGKILILDEIYAKDKTKTHTEAIYNEFLRKAERFEPDISRWQVVYDDQAVWFSNELLHQFKLASYPAKKQSVEKEDGIALMKQLFLTKNQVIISKLCTNLMNEIENYIMLENGKYPKVNDHLIDCFRYFLTFAHVVLSLAEGDELSEDMEEFYDYELEALYDDTGLPGWIQ